MNAPNRPAPFPVFAPGDRVPDFVLPDVLGNPFGLTLSAVGKPLVIAVAGREPERHLRPLVAAAECLQETTVLCVTRLDPGGNKALAERLRLPFALLSDRQGQVSKALLKVAEAGAPEPPLAVYTLDRNQRIRRVVRGDDADRIIGDALPALTEMLPPPEPAPVPRPAPLLSVPGVLEPEFCRELIDAWERQGNVATGTINALSEARESYDDRVKRRRDHYVRDKTLMQRIAESINRRVAPEIDKAFCFQATRAEEFKVACYDAASGGYFRPHRDNLSERTAHRRFAMSLLLNEPGDYEGGELRFPEYGPELYRPRAGEAVIFSCSLLHEVLPVSSGRRYVLLCFLFGEAEAQRLAARAKQRTR